MLPNDIFMAFKIMSGLLQNQCVYIVHMYERTQFKQWWVSHKINRMLLITKMDLTDG